MVAKFVKDSFKNYDWRFDKKVIGGCSRKRPDQCVDFGSHVLVIEVDEDKHQGYSCENLRMMTLFQDFGNRPLVMIRFNPDKYTDSTGKIHKSCFIKRKTGTLEIFNQKQWKIRLNTLKKTIEEYALDYVADKEVRIIQLYFG